MKSINALLAVIVLALGATQLSCNVNDYCLNCGTGDAGGGSGSGDANDGGGDIDAAIDAGCVPTGAEQCDGADNDCNGLVDDGVIAGIGDLCLEQDGACAGGHTVCVNGQTKCDKLPSPETCDFIDNNCNGMVDEGDPGGGGKCGTDMGECIAGTLRCQSVTGCNPAANCDPLVSGNNCCVKCTGFTDHRAFPELCNAKDDNCNGQFDENLTNLGACTWMGATNNGECNIGTLSCVGGNPQCSGAVFPKFELCNSLDDDCDTMTDEIFNKNIDPRNCGACNNICAAKTKTCAGGANAKMACTMNSDCPSSTCEVNSQPCCGPGCAPSKPANPNGTCNFECNVGYINLNNTASDGCEYKCSPSGNEECDGVDNNCNGQVDEGLTPPPLCLSGGECGGGESGANCSNAVDNDADGLVNDGCPQVGGTAESGSQCTDAVDSDADGVVNDGCPISAAATTATCMGAQGWKCNYPAATEFPESSCDNKNNDCDANIDEGFPGKGTACNDGEPGVCRDTGTLQCNAAMPMGGLVCAYTTSNPNLNGMPSLPGAMEDCNAKDDDCDSKVDETLVTGQTWITLTNGKQMMKYEASKPDATATDSGINPAIVCSRSGVQPWTNISYPQAQAACSAIGARLCTESEWHRTCSVVATTTPPFAVTTAATTFIEAEDYTGIAYNNAAAEGTCTGAVDDDADGRVNDGCAAQPGGTPVAETNCTDNVDNDLDGFVNDGCPAFGAAMRAWVPDYTGGFSGIAAMEATPNTFGGGVVIANIATQAPKLDYAVTVAAGTYHVQLKMYQTAYAGDNDVAFVSMTGTATATQTVTLPAPLACATDANCSTLPGGKCIDTDFDMNSVPDHCAGWRWADSTFATVGAGAQTISVFMGDDGVKVDKLALTQTSTAPADTVAGSGNIWAYSTAPNTYAPMTCNGHDFSAANDNVLATGSLASCFADGSTTNDAFDMSGNVKEWTTRQEPGQNPVRGGASNNTGSGIACALNFTVADDDFIFPNIGFRCCK